MPSKSCWYPIITPGTLICGEERLRGILEESPTSPFGCDVLLGRSNGEVKVRILGSFVPESHSSAMPGQDTDEVQRPQLGKALHLTINGVPVDMPAYPFAKVSTFMKVFQVAGVQMNRHRPALF